MHGLLSGPTYPKIEVYSIYWGHLYLRPTYT